MKTPVLWAVSSLVICAVVPDASAQVAAAKPIKAKYVCDKGQSLRVIFLGDKAFVTPKGGKTITLRHGITADGFLYSKGKYSLRGRGDDATWTVGARKPVSCHAKS